ncbi:MAG: HAD hydrolase-like protein [Solirubrobacterales bacterium]|nr:HAD hydrolase-like protein [Solirubrobacterales bacterium]
MLLDDVRGFVFDIDGTLVHRAGDHLRVQPGAREVLARIRLTGRPLVLFTNGSHAPPESFAAALRAAGLEIGNEEVLTPLCSLPVYLAAGRYERSVLLFGTAPAREYVVRSGVRVLDRRNGDQPDVVFVAHPEAADFEELEHAARAVLAGARLLTGSYARAYAGADGLIFSRGAMLTAALAKATGARPVVVGKPSRAAVRTVVDRLGVNSEQVAVIGDDLGMDVALGRLGGSRTVLVRSGITGGIDLTRVPANRRPDAAVDGVAELLEWL